MSRYILDTDRITLFQHGNSKIALRAKAIGGSNIFVTTVTLEEQVQGRLAKISKANKKPDQLVIAYSNLRSTLTYFCNVNLLDFDNTAYNLYQSLRQQKIRVGTQDLKIAAIALGNQTIIVTRNQQDFNNVPNLTCEDWSV